MCHSRARLGQLADAPPFLVVKPFHGSKRGFHAEEPAVRKSRERQSISAFRVANSDAPHKNGWNLQVFDL